MHTLVFVSPPLPEIHYDLLCCYYENAIFRYVLGAVETFLDAVPSAGFFQGALLLIIQIQINALAVGLFLRILCVDQLICTFG